MPETTPNQFEIELAEWLRAKGIRCAVVTYRWGRDQCVMSVSDGSRVHNNFVDNMAKLIDDYLEATNKSKGRQN